VKRGDVIDFITDCRENPKSDAFKWSPIIKNGTDTEPGQREHHGMECPEGFQRRSASQTPDSVGKFAQVMFGNERIDVR